MSDGVPKSRVTLTYDTKQPEGREKPRELPFRLLVLGDVGGEKNAPLDQRKVRQLNGRNLGEVIRGLKIKVRDVDLGDRKTEVLIESMSSFSPDDVLRLLTGQKARSVTKLDPMLQSAWGADASVQSLWPGDSALMKRWEEREKVVAFQKLYQNSKALRTALKRFSAPPGENDKLEQLTRKGAIAQLRAAAKSKLAADAKQAVDAATEKQKGLAAAAAANAKDAAAAKLAADAGRDVAEATAEATKLAAEATEEQTRADAARAAMLEYVAEAKAKKQADDAAKGVS